MAEISKVKIGSGAADTIKDTTAREQIATLANKCTSKAEASGGTTESLVTTGEKYKWNHNVLEVNPSTPPTTNGAMWITTT